MAAPVEQDLQQYPVIAAVHRWAMASFLARSRSWIGSGAPGSGASRQRAACWARSSVIPHEAQPLLRNLRRARDPARGRHQRHRADLGAHAVHARRAATRGSPAMRARGRRSAWARKWIFALQDRSEVRAVADCERVLHGRVVFSSHGGFVGLLDVMARRKPDSRHDSESREKKPLFSAVAGRVSGSFSAPGRRASHRARQAPPPGCVATCTR